MKKEKLKNVSWKTKKSESERTWRMFPANQTGKAAALPRIQLGRNLKWNAKVKWIFINGTSFLRIQLGRNLKRNVKVKYIFKAERWISFFPYPAQSNGNFLLLFFSRHGRWWEPWQTKDCFKIFSAAALSNMDDDCRPYHLPNSIFLNNFWF